MSSVNYHRSSFNRPVFSTYSIVFFIIFLSPNNKLVLIPSAPTFLLNMSLSSSYSSQFSRKWSIVSFAAPHSHSGVSIMLKRCRYSFRRQWPVRNRVMHTTCLRCCSVPYMYVALVLWWCQGIDSYFASVLHFLCPFSIRFPI